jgi:hypothetical protein
MEPALGGYAVDDLIIDAHAQCSRVRVNTDLIAKECRLRPMFANVAARKVLKLKG